MPPCSAQGVLDLTPEEPLIPTDSIFKKDEAGSSGIAVCSRVRLIDVDARNNAACSRMRCLHMNFRMPEAHDPPLHSRFVVVED